jgi:hypothetical protein
MQKDIINQPSLWVPNCSVSLVLLDRIQNGALVSDLMKIKFQKIIQDSIQRQAAGER